VLPPLPLSANLYERMGVHLSNLIRTLNFFISIHILNLTFNSFILDGGIRMAEPFAAGGNRVL
jgi:hypothetical protein